MLTASRSSLRWWALILLVGIGFAVTLVTSGSPQIKSSSSSYMSRPRQPESVGLPAAGGAPVSRRAATDDPDRLHFHDRYAGSTSRDSSACAISPPDFRSGNYGAHIVGEAGRQAVASYGQQLAREPVDTGRRLPACRKLNQSSHSRAHGFAVGQLRQHFSANGPRHGTLGRSQYPPDSSVRHLLVSCAQAWIGDISIPRRYGRFLDHQWRSRNPRHSA